MTTVLYNKLELLQFLSVFTSHSLFNAFYGNISSCLNITVQMVSATVTTVLILIIITMTVLMTTTVQRRFAVQHQTLAL